MRAESSGRLSLSCDDPGMPAHAEDVVIVGAGIVGCATAYFLARAGASVAVYEAGAAGSGASGRSAGLVEHPYDAAQEPLYVETVALLKDLLGEAMPASPIGVLLLTGDERAAEELAARYRVFASLAPAVLSPEALRAAEPHLVAGDAWACLLQTGYPVQPARTTLRWADAAREHGARFHLDTRVSLARGSDNGGTCGVRTRDRVHRAGAVIVAAGAASSAVIDPSGAWCPVFALWGVSVTVRVGQRPRHAILDGRVGAIQSGDAFDEAAFSLIPTPHRVAIGSTFLPEKPSGETWGPRLIDEGTLRWPMLADADEVEVAVCARPRAFDGRPLLGRVEDERGLWLAAGHGGRGISTGPASARILAEAVLSGDDGAIPAALRADRAGSAVRDHAGV